MNEFDNQEIASIFQKIDVLVVPSLWPENSPLVIHEAFLTRTPVIASRIGGISEIVTDGVNGLLFNPGDVNELKEKMQYLIDNPDIIERLRANIPKTRSMEDNGREMEEIYADLLKK
jgi:glycosyltransferase involved in cell wall biosynthesis